MKCIQLCQNLNKINKKNHEIHRWHFFFVKYWKTFSRKVLSGPNTGCFSPRRALLGARTLAPKKTFFFQDKLYSLKSHAYYFNVFRYLATWRADKLGIFTHFTFTNLPRCSQNMNLLILTHKTLYRSPAVFNDSLITVVITLLRAGTAQNISAIPPDPNLPPPLLGGRENIFNTNCFRITN